MDFDGDGHRDVLSGSWPGQVFLFRGQEDGTHAAAEKLVDATGAAIKFSASVPFATDWDGDGDLDLLLGEKQGRVMLLTRETNEEGSTFSEAVPLTVDGAEIRVGGWQRRPDGRGLGWRWHGRPPSSAVAMAKRTSIAARWARTGPTLSAPVSLLKRSTGRFGEPTEQTSGCGMRVKLAVADWNGDGAADLLFGDYYRRQEPGPELTPEQITERNELQARQRAATKIMSERAMALQKEVRAELGLPESGAIPPEQVAAFSTAYRDALAADEEYQPAFAEYTEIRQTLAPLQPVYTTHGHVYVMLRKAAAPVTDTGAAPSDG